MNPGSTLAAYLILTVSIAATTSLFSVINSLLIKPLPFADADQVVLITAVDRGTGSIKLSLPDTLDIQQRAHDIDALAFYRDFNGNIGARPAESIAPIVVHILEINADLFRVMGVHIAQGRPFSPDANRPGRACEAVISWRLWQTRFEGKPIAGQSIRLNEQPCLVDGVLP